MKGKIITASGKEDDPAWPVVDGSLNNPPVIGDTRAGEKKESYVVKAKRVGTDEIIEIKEIRNAPLNHTEFMKLRKGTSWEATFNGLGSLLKINFEKKK
jgi:hypothetical protein